MAKAIRLQCGASRVLAKAYVQNRATVKQIRYWAHRSTQHTAAPFYRGFWNPITSTALALIDELLERTKGIGNYGADE